MRTLKFIVDGQILKQDPTCNFEGLVPGTEDYIRAEFSFSQEWGSCRMRVASFWSVMGKEYPPKVLENGKVCIIPAEALKKRTFKVQIIGWMNGSKVTTNKVAVIQKGGKA